MVTVHVAVGSKGIPSHAISPLHLDGYIDNTNSGGWAVTTIEIDVPKELERVADNIRIRSVHGVVYTDDQWILNPLLFTVEGTLIASVYEDDWGEVHPGVWYERVDGEWIKHSVPNFNNH